MLTEEQVIELVKVCHWHGVELSTLLRLEAEDACNIYEEAVDSGAECAIVDEMGKHVDMLDGIVDIIENAAKVIEES